MTFQNRSNSHPKTPDVVVVVMVVVMVMMLVLFFIDHALNIAELLHVARDGDGALLIESVLFLGFLQKLHEERVVDIDHWDHKPLLLLPLTYQDCQTPLWNIFQVLLFMVMKAVKVRHMKVEIHVVFVSTSHNFSSANYPQIKQEETRKRKNLIVLVKNRRALVSRN